MSNTVHHLLIFASDSRIPTNLTFIAEKWDTRRFRYSGQYAVVGAPRLMRLLAATLCRMGNTMAQETHFFDSIEEAAAFIKQRRTQINTS